MFFTWHLRDFYIIIVCHLWLDRSEVICDHMISLKHLLFHRPGFEYAEQIELLYSLCED